MTVESLGPMVAPPALERGTTSPVPAKERPVIDADTIKAILFLGLKGDAIVRGATGGSGPEGGGVDTYA